MKILLLGKNGQVGWELARALAPLGEVLAIDRHSDPPVGDVARLDEIRQTVGRVRPDVIVNATAFTDVDRAERERNTAAVVNGRAPGVLAEAAREAGALFVHYGTDYVFGGAGDMPWRETDRTGPLNVYGHTKLDGEERIRAAGGQYIIVRVSWVYAARGENFAKTIVRLARERQSLSVVADQFGAPTGADLIADTTALMIAQVTGTKDRAPLLGTFHLAPTGSTSRHAYASFVVDRARTIRPDIEWTVREIEAAAAERQQGRAIRPKNSRLDTTKLRSAYRLTLPPWETGLERMLNEWLSAECIQ